MTQSLLRNTDADCQNYKGRSGESELKKDKLREDSEFTLLESGTNKTSFLLQVGADVIFKKFYNEA